MQAIEIRQAQEHIAAERLQSAAGVAGAVAQHRAAHGIGDARLQLLETAGLAPGALSRDQPHDRRARLQRAQHGRDESRIVLAVAIDRHHHRRARRRHARAHRRRLTARLLVPDAAQKRMQRHQPLQFIFGAVGRAVIDIDDLERPLAGQRRCNLGNQRRDVAGFVADRHDDGHRWIVAVHGCSLLIQKLAGN